ncbi:MAG: hypothetical protein AAFY57_04255 [Cyanobacteria bacterium J06642_2]
MNTTDVLNEFQRKLDRATVQIQSQERDLHVLIAGEVICDLEAFCREVAATLVNHTDTAWDTFTVWVRESGQAKSSPAVHFNLIQFKQDLSEATSGKSEPTESAPILANAIELENQSAAPANPSTTPAALEEAKLTEAAPIMEATQTVVPEAAPQVESSDSEPASEVLDLSQYCFTSNTMLLTHKLPPPNKSVAEAVWFFHQLDDVAKQQMIPAIASFFRAGEEGEPESLSPEMEEWFETTKEFDERKLKSLSVWLSRYCRAPEATIPELKKGINPYPSTPSEAPDISESDVPEIVEPAPIRSTNSETRGKWNVLTLGTFALLIPVLFGTAVLIGRVHRAQNTVIHLQLD